MIKETVQYVYTADTKNAQKNVKDLDTANDKLDVSTGKVDKSSSGLSGTLGGGTSAMLGYGAAIGGAVVVVNELGQATTEMVGEQNKFNAAFKESSESTTAQLQVMGSQLAITTRELGNTASAMTLTAVNMGMSEEAAQKYGVEVANLAGITSSYLGIPMAETSERLTAAMRGEAESAEMLGLSLGDTAMANYVLQQSGEDTWGTMNDVEKMAWREKAAIEQVGAIMGLTGTSAWELANEQERLAMMTEMAAEQTTGYQKFVYELKETMNELLNAIIPLVDLLFNGLMAVIGQLIIMFQQLMPVIQPIIEQFMILVQALLPPLNALFQVLLGHLQMLWGLFLILVEVLQPLITALMQLLTVVLPPLISAITVLYQVMSILFNIIGQLIVIIQGVFLGILMELANLIMGVLVVAWNTLIAVVNAVIGAFSTFANILQTVVVTAINIVLVPINLLIGALETVLSLFGSVLGFAGKIVPGDLFGFSVFGGRQSVPQSSTIDPNVLSSSSSNMSTTNNFAFSNMTDTSFMTVQRQARFAVNHQGRLIT